MALPSAALLLLTLIFLVISSAEIVVSESKFAKSLPGVSNNDIELANTPPRGWNSYDSFSWIIDEEEFLENADILSKRLLQYGYEFAVIDFLWYRRNVDGSSIYAYGYDNIDEWGRVFPDPDRWPSSKVDNGFKQLASEIHSMGLKFGIHLMRGISKQAVDANKPILDIYTGRAYVEDGKVWGAKDIGLTQMACGWMPNGFMSINTDLGAGRAFLRSLYQQYADWDVDFVKLDCVFGDDLDEKEIIAVSQLLKGLDRPILLSLSPGTSVTTSMAEGISDLVNMYRITGDDWDTWEDVVGHFNISRDFAAANKIGSYGLKGRSWPDMDMLPLGWLTDPGVRQGPHRYCRLNLNEQKTQMTLWSMVKSPLMFGGDLRNIDDTTFGLITNPYLLEINTYSSNNMEYPFIYTKEGSVNPVVRQRSINSREGTTNHKKIVSLVGCKSKKAKGWSLLTSSNQDFDELCWHSYLRNDSLEYCLYKMKTVIKLNNYVDQNGKEAFQLLPTMEMGSCLGALMSKRHSASNIRSLSSSACKERSHQV